MSLAPHYSPRKDRYKTGKAREGSTFCFPRQSADARLRYPLEVFDTVRAVWPAAKPLAVALNADDWARGGLRLPDAVEIASQLRAHGCDLLLVQAGQTTHASQPNYDFETLASYADVLRNESGLPVLATPYVTTANQANTLLAGGRCDLCVVWGR